MKNSPSNINSIIKDIKRLNHFMEVIIPIDNYIFFYNFIELFQIRTHCVRN